MNKDVSSSDRGHAVMDPSGTITRGRIIYLAGEEGTAWRVRSGTVRLDQPGPEAPQFAGLAQTGDVIGAETLLFGRYTFTASALSPCVLEPWLSAQSEPSGETLLQLLTATERRMAEVLALRNGKAGERIRRLIEFMGARLGQGRRAGKLALPRLKDIAEITGLTVETVSRTITHMGEEGALEVVGSYRSRQVSAGPAVHPRSPLSGTPGR